MKAPLVLFVYNRLELTKKVIEALKNNYEIDQTELFIFSDMAKSDTGNDDQVYQVREYIWDLKRNNKIFKSISIIEAQTNKGLANSVIDGVTEILNQYEAVIVLEDDLVTARTFVRFMNCALDYYKNDKHIWSVTGYSFPLFSLKKYKNDVFFTYRGMSWGWATWKDRWDKVDWSISDFDSFKHDIVRQKEFNRGGSDMTRMLTMQMNGECDSWAIRWCYQQYKEKMLTVYPTRSQILNLGFDGRGTHTNKSILKIFGTRLVDYPERINLIDSFIDERIIKEMNRAYSKNLIDRLLIVLAKHIKI